MKIIFQSIMLFLFLLLCGCRQSKIAIDFSELEGIWALNNDGFATIQENKCSLKKIDLVDYEISGNKIIVKSEQSLDSFLIRDYSVDHLTLVHRNELYHYQKVFEQDRVKIQSLSFTITDDGYFTPTLDLKMDKTGKLVLRIRFDVELGKGYYKGFLPEYELCRLEQFINTCSLPIKDEFKEPMIMSGGDWALIIQTQDGNEFRFYSGYQDLPKQLDFLARMVMLQWRLLYLDKNKPELSDSIFQSRSFLEKEWARNYHSLKN